MSGYKPKSLRDGRMPIIIVCAGVMAVVIFSVILFTNDKQTEELQVNVLEDRIDEMDGRFQKIDQALATLEDRLSRLETSIPLITEQIEKQLDEFQKNLGDKKPDGRRPAAKNRAGTASAVEKKEPEVVKPVKKPEESQKIKLHKVAHGETLYQISKKYDLTVEELMKLNNLSTSDSIYPDQLLRVK